MNNTWYIHLMGQVQGVGFRPFVYGLAIQQQLKGWVNNTIDGVHIQFNADKVTALQFYQQVLENAPVLSRITHHSLEQIAFKNFDNFQIINSETQGEAQLLITPDFALCPNCRKELHEPANRRNNYPFITCTHCGPRYSIIQSLPYDRETTTMDVFSMCSNCHQEYHNPTNRRYFSQSNSCEKCGVKLTLVADYRGRTLSKCPTPEPDELFISPSFNDKRFTPLIDVVLDKWKAGKIVAIKGIGGYLLTCDAANEKAILELRKRKHRPSKPFALMLPNLESIHKIARVKKEEKEALQSPIAPIVLLETKKEAADYLVLKAIAPNLNQLGIMLPYTPLYDLLLKKWGKAIVATSGNISHSPIVFEDEKALAELSEIADYILLNNRKIVVPQDDSVLRFSFFKNKKILLRRSRGIAPTYINANLKCPSESVLAMGAMLKSTFALWHQGNTYISQYLGDLQHFDTQQSYQHTLQHFLKLLRFDNLEENLDLVPKPDKQSHPKFILTDLHPNYPSSQFGQDLATKWNVPLQKIQHHYAHFAAILGEQHLIHQKIPVLGVIWDGTGYGTDGQIWGGEFFVFEKKEFSRLPHFEYFPHILGDKMAKEPRIAALAACWKVEDAADILKEKFAKTEWQVYQRLLKKEQRLTTSSVGRIFDAVASLLGILDKQTFEGEAAMQLESLALAYCKKNGLDFSLQEVQLPSLSVTTLMQQIINHLKNELPKDFIAAQFHFSLVAIIKNIAIENNIQKIAFSGGVFQNGLLTDLLIHHLDKDFELYFHEQLSPNDENIAFGQLIAAFRDGGFPPPSRL